MDIGEPERSGRHRLDDGAAQWLPLGGELDHAPAPHAKPAQRPPGAAIPNQRDPQHAPQQHTAQQHTAQQHTPHDPRRAPRRDPLADTDSTGLGKFNIGLVPASVTPPRTWKRAAWFAVLSSAGVLVGLAVAAAKLVGSGAPTDRIGMPGYPTAAPIVTGFGTSTPPPSAPLAPGKRGGSEQPGAPAAPDGMAAAPPSATRGTPGPDAAETALPHSSASPTVTTVPSSGKPVVDATAIAARTERFYEEAADNSDTAITMVADTFQADARALLEQRFGEVALIEVTEIKVDPARGVTISTLRVTNKDGSTTTEQRQLVFTTSGDPLINAERLFGGV